MTGKRRPRVRGYAMQDLISAKLDPPRWMDDQIRRESLLGRLQGVLNYRLTLVHAPAGYGKTSLLSQWRDSLDTAAVRVASLPLARDDRELQRFVNYLLLALQRTGTAHAAWGASRDLTPRAALSAIINPRADPPTPVYSARHA